MVLTAADSDAGGLEVIDVDAESETVGDIGVQSEFVSFGDDNEDDSGEDSSFEPLFGTTDIDIIELEGSDNLVFAGERNDLVDAAISD